MCNDPVVFVVRLFCVTQYETTGIHVGRTDDLYAVFTQCLQGRHYAGRNRAVAGADVNDGLGAGLSQCLVGGVINVAVRVGDTHVWQALDVLDVELRVHGVTLGRQAEPVGFAFNHHAQCAPWAFERFGLDVHHFADIAARLDLVVHGDQNAFATGFFAACYSNGVVQVQHAVSGHCGARTHRAHHHDWLVGLFNQVQEVGGLFQCVGTVSDHDAIDVFAVGQFGNTAAQLQQVVVGDAFRGDLHHLFATHVGQLAQLGHTCDQLIDAHFGSGVGCAVGSAGACACDGAAGGQNDHIRLGSGFLCVNGWHDQQKGQSARNNGFQHSFFHYVLS